MAEEKPMPAEPNRVRDVFLSAAEVTAAARAAYLDSACGPDVELRVAVERLLDAHANPAKVLEATVGPARPAPSSDTGPHTPLPDTGTILAGRYKLLEQIGEGGMGAVWVAQQIEPVKRTVAIKLIKPGMDTKTVLARFEAERQALALMDHPNIARVLDAGMAADGRPYFVMELVKGTPITRYCDANKLTPRQRLELFVPVCHAIQHAHQKGIIHRDIKPSNILVALYDDRAVPKVIDFGVAKATGQSLTEQTLNTGFGAVVGTPQYMSPEQATFNNLDIDTRSDLYSLGVLLYELLAGSPPFTKKDFEQAGMLEMLRVLREVEPPRPSTKLSSAAALPSLAANRSMEPKKLTGMLRNELDWIVMKALEKDRSRRYETANGFAADVLRYLSGEPVQAVPPSLQYRLKKFVRRHRPAVAAAALLLAALLVGFAGIVVGLIRATAAREAESEQRQFAETESQRANSEAAHARDEAAKAQASAAAEKLAVRKAHRLLGLINATEGQKLADEGKLHLGLLRMVQSLANATESPEAEAMARVQFANYRRYAPTTLGLRMVLPHQSVSAAFSPNGRLVLTGGNDNAARVWDANSGQLLTPALKHAGPIMAVAFSPDSRRVVTGSYDGTAQVWNAHSGERIGEILRHDGPVNGVAFSPDGRRVATSLRDSKVQVWDAATGNRVTAPLQHGSLVSAIAFSPDGRRVLSGSWDGTARVWDANSGQELLNLKHPERVETAVFSPDGQRILTGCQDKFARIWDAHTGERIGDSLRHGDQVQAVAFAPDGQRVATGSDDKTARIWDAHTGKPLSPPLENGSIVWWVAFSPDGRRLLTADMEKTVRVWDANTGKPLLLPLQHGDYIGSAEFSADGRRILVGSDVARIWDLAATKGAPAPTLRFDYQRPEERAELMVLSPDRRRVLKGNHLTARTWDVETGLAVSAPMVHNGLISAAAFSRDGRQVVTGTDAKSISVWDAETGARLCGPLPYQTGIRSVDFSHDGRLVVAGDQRMAQVWDVTSGRAVSGPLEHSGSVHAVVFAPDGRSVLTGSEDKTAVVWDATNGKVLTRFVEHRHAVQSVAFSPDGRRALTGGGPTARIWAPETGREITPPLKHDRFVMSVAFSPDGNRAITGNWENTARVWDAHTGKPLAPHLTHSNLVNCVAFSRDGRQILTGSHDTTARLWDGDTGTPLSPPLPHADRVRCAAFSLDGRQAITGCGTGAVSKWGLSPDARPGADLIGLAQLFAGHRCDETGAFTPLTTEESFRLWTDLKARYPQEFTVSPEAVRKWREAEIHDCLKEGNLHAAQFHYWALVAELASNEAR
jgi:eukaryotic-like serine/threonine-protein kinase